ncbi:single-strand DNA endonuclease 1 [Rutidosis leptorrhynchoides]|uniref:single-strand DNA endonuclease 1 n=1 Tax=Rutidosis leptorrhynchoides TaxID=125765 RepID=UPI003A9912A6
MGVRNLWDILEPCKKTLPLHHLQNKKVCIDLSCWMVQLANVNKSHCSMKDKVYLKGLFHRIRALIALNCSIIFVTDGSIPGIKVATYRRRLQNNEGTRDESSSENTISLQRNMGSEFSCMIKEAKILGSALGVPCIDAIEEGEAQCALLDSESLCDGCFSIDSDIFLFGARTVYRDICLGEGGYVVCYEMSDIENKLGLGRNSLIALAVLLGCDYTPGVRGLRPQMACEIVKSMGETVVLQKLAAEGFSLLKKTNFSKKRNQVRKGFNNKENIPPNNTKENIARNESNINEWNNQFQQVIDAYLKPKCHSADSQMVQRVLGTYPFQRITLQRKCHQFFEWPPEKTDEYILPKIAERELRRFVNLRTASSNLGLQFPLNKMPVKCPVSEIVKRRIAQGKECFEVMWVDIDGLSGSSIVPGDLVHSACPEKIVELEERIAEKKKPKPRKPRLKKTETNHQSLNVVDSKLNETSSNQNYWLLDETPVKTSMENYEPLVNTRSNNEENYRLFDEPLVNMRSNVEENYRLLDEPLVNMRSNPKVVKNIDEPADNSCYDVGPEVVNLSTPVVIKSNKKVETEIVDLLSPMSAVSISKHQKEDIDVDFLSPMSDICVSKHQEQDVEFDLVSPMSDACVSKHAEEDVDVIDLSESEMDVSPEHAKKARELRLFVAKIRNE